MRPIRSILVATDFSECSREAVDRAVDLATEMGAKLIVLHVWGLSPITLVGAEYAMVDLLGPIEEAASAQLREEVQRLEKRLPSVDGELRFGVPWEEIVAAAKAREVDLVIVGTIGRTGLGHALLGSVAEKVLRLSPVPVLTVPHGKAAASELARSGLGPSDGALVSAR